MAKIIIEFDENEDYKSDILAAIDRQSLVKAINDIRDLYSQIYNNKIYDSNVQIYLKADGKKATEEDYKKVNLEGTLLQGGKYYISQEWIEETLDNILENVKQFLI